MITPSAAQAAGESTEQKIARLERELAAAQAQRDKAIAHLVNMLHAADDLANCANLNVWDTEIAMTRGFLKECGK